MSPFDMLSKTVSLTQIAIKFRNANSQRRRLFSILNKKGRPPLASIWRTWKQQILQHHGENIFTYHYSHKSVRCSKRWSDISFFYLLIANENRTPCKSQLVLYCHLHRTKNKYLKWTTILVVIFNHFIRQINLPNKYKYETLLTYLLFLQSEQYTNNLLKFYFAIIVSSLQFL